MTTVSELVKQGLRDGNLLPIGREPFDAEETEALARFNNIVQSLTGFEGGEFLREWPVPPNRTSPVNAQWPLHPRNRDLPDNEWPYPNNNSNLICTITSNTTIYMPGFPQDMARMRFVNAGMTADLTLDGNGRLIEGATSKTMLSTDTGNRQWIYRADLGDWKYVPVTFALTDECPFAPEWDDLFISALSIRLSGRYSKNPTQGTLETYRSSLRRFKARSWQTTPQEVGSPLGPRDSYGSDIQTGRTS